VNNKWKVIKCEKDEGSHCFDLSRPPDVMKGRGEKFNESEYKENYNEQMCCFLSISSRYGLCLLFWSLPI
jgi:hypothetical protein